MNTYTGGIPPKATAKNYNLPSVSPSNLSDMLLSPLQYTTPAAGSPKLGAQKLPSTSEEEDGNNQTVIARILKQIIPDQKARFPKQGEPIAVKKPQLESSKTLICIDRIPITTKSIASPLSLREASTKEEKSMPCDKCQNPDVLKTLSDGYMCLTCNHRF